MPMAEMVGLQLLLQPNISAPFFRAACNVTAVLYPMYRTYKVLEDGSHGTSTANTSSVNSLTTGYGNRRATHSLNSAADTSAPGEEEEQRNLLTYWAAYGAVSMLTDWQLCRLPYYYHAKFALLLWLNHEGARTLYQQVLRPGMKKYEPKVDACLHHLHLIAITLYCTYRVPIEAARYTVTFAASQVVSFVRWFFKEDQPPSPPRRMYATDRAPMAASGTAGVSNGSDGGGFRSGGSSVGLQNLVGNGF